MNTLTKQNLDSIAYGERESICQINKQLNILLVANRFPPFIGGVEMHTFEVGRRMAAKGHNVTVLTGDPASTLPSEQTMSGMRVRRVPVYPKGSDVYFAPDVYREVVRLKTDIIHIQGFHTFVPPIAILAAIRKSAAFVMTFHSGGHSSPLRNSIRGIQCAVLRPLIARADRLIGVSEFEADHFAKGLRIPRDRFVVVPNGAEIATPPVVTAPDPVKPLIVSVGRLERYKGHHRVIAAFGELLHRRPEAKLRICGEGPYKSQLLDQVRKLGLDASVTVGGIPPKERHQMGALMASASAVVLLSDYEAHPVAALEAISLGRPVLASNSTGFAEMAAKGQLEGIDPNSAPERVADAILTLIDRPKTSRPPVDIGNWDDCTRNLLEIYGEVLASRIGARREDRSPVAVRATA